MSNTDILGYILILLILGIILYIYFDNESFQLKCIVSTVDGNKYCVRERAKLQEAADLLAKTTEKCKRLVKYMSEKHPDNVTILCNHVGSKIVGYESETLCVCFFRSVSPH